MNVEILRRVQRLFKRSPEVLDMGSWVGEREGCGTVGCIAGWVCILDSHGKRVRHLKGREPWEISSTARTRAEKLLGLSPNDVDGLFHTAAYRLFYRHAWPGEFERRISALEPGTAEYAKVVCDRIDHFIATEGRE